MLRPEVRERVPSVSLASVTYSPSVILTGAKTLSYGANMQATRLAKAQGMSDLTSTNVDTKMLEVEQAQASAEAQARLSELRSELGLTSPETEKPAPAPQPAEAEKPAEKPSS